MQHSIDFHVTNHVSHNFCPTGIALDNYTDTNVLFFLTWQRLLLVLLMWVQGYDGLHCCTIIPPWAYAKFNMVSSRVITGQSDVKYTWFMRGLGMQSGMVYSLVFAHNQGS